jgi:hypothetical protein
LADIQFKVVCRLLNSGVNCEFPSNCVNCKPGRKKHFEPRKAQWLLYIHSATYFKIKHVSLCPTQCMCGLFDLQNEGENA